MNPDQQNQQLNPSIVNLTKALGMSESNGNYNAKLGADMEQGAYQMTPAFIQRYAPQYLGNSYVPNAPLSPAEQDKLVYSVVNDWATKGDSDNPHLGPLSPAQIASKFNSGDPNAYLNPDFKGTSKGGAKYDTPQYVQRVQQNYEKLTGTTQSSNGINTAQAAETAPSSKQGQSMMTPDQFNQNAFGSTNPSLDQMIFGPAGLKGVLLGGATGAAALIAPELLGMLGGGAEATGGSVLSKIAGLVKGAGKGLLYGAAGNEAINLGEKALGINQGGTSGGDGGNVGGDVGTQSNPIISQLLNNSSGLSNRIGQAFGSTPTGRALLQNDKNTQEAIQAMGIYGLAPETDEFGAMDFSGAKSRASNLVKGLSQNVSEALSAEGTTANVREAFNEAQQHIRQTLPSSEWEAADKRVEDQAAKYMRNFGKKGNMSLGDFQRMKQELSYGQKYGILETSATKGGDKALAFGARRVIEKHTKNPALYNQVMKEEQKLINARKIMKRLEGKRAPKQETGALKHILHASAKYAGAYIGDKIGGPVGAILGYLMTNEANKAIEKAHSKTIFETPEVTKLIENLHKQNPEVYNRLIAELKKRNIKVMDKNPKPGSAFPKAILSKSQNKLKGAQPREARKAPKRQRR